MIRMITIINYGMGNLGSVANMIKRIGHNSMITSDIQKIKSAEKIILPGVGAFDKAMEKLDKLNLIEVLNKKALVDKVPILGICLGMQLLSKKSEEGNLSGLGWIDAEIIKFKFEDKKLKIPHMGWNTVDVINKGALFDNLAESPRFYFVHSYHAKCENKKYIMTITNYGYDYVSSICKDNIYGVQFHPEKSHKFGMKLLKNFIENI